MASRKRSPKPPQWLVVFDKPSKALPGSLEHLDLQVEDQESHCHVLHRPGGKAPREPERFWPALGIACVNMNEKQHAAVKATGGVRHVLPNRIRKAPRHVGPVSARGSGPVRGRGGSPVTGRGSSPVRGRGSSPVEGRGWGPVRGRSAEAESALESYIRGWVDSANNLAESLFAPHDAERVEFDAPTSEAHAAHLTQIGLEPGYVNVTGAGQTVAVLDTGIDLKHPDFRDRNKTGRPRLVTKSFVPGTRSAQDDNGHGTACCGLIAGPIESSGGTRYGVAPDADLVVAKVLNTNREGYDSWVLDGLAWAVAEGATVVSLSLGAPRSAGEPFSPAYEFVARHLLAEQGGNLLLVASGGNSTGAVAPIEDPAAAPMFMAVGAVDEDLVVAPFSCEQRDSVGLVDLVAPGVNVYTAQLGGTFGYESGTSMAAPIVAGAACLYRSVDPNMTGYQLWWLLEQNAWPLGSPASYGRGLVRAP